MDNTKKESNAGRQLKKIIRKNSKYLVGIVFLSVVTSALSSVNPLLQKKIVDDAIPNKDLKLALICIILMAAIPLFNVAMSTLNQKCGYCFTAICRNDLRRFYFRKILEMDYPAFMRIGPVKLMSVITRTIGKISSLYLNDDIIKASSSLVRILVIFGVLFYYNKIVAVTTFVVVPFTYFVIKFFDKKESKSLDNQKNHLQKCEKFLLQVFNGMKTIRSYSGQKKEINTFDEWLDKDFYFEWKYNRDHILIRTFIPTAISEVILGSIFAACSVSVMKDTMTIGTLFAVVSYVPMLIVSIQSMLNLKIGEVSISKLVDELDLIFAEKSEFGADDEDQAVDGSRIAFRDVDFTYGRENFDLKIENLEIEKGDFITIVGTTGGGKSSIMDIINKYYPISSGEVLFGEESIDEISSKALRKHIGTMFQDVYMFNGTIAENIAYPEKPDTDRLNDVIEKAQLTSFINALPNKTDEIVETGGANFSGGECQRMALARMLYKKADIYLLDEPTSALDAETSKAIFEMLDKENKESGKTILLITHDPGKATYGNKVMVVSGGRIAEYGNPEELIRQNGAFASLYNAQQAIKSQ